MLGAQKSFNKYLLLSLSSAGTSKLTCKGYHSKSDTTQLTAKWAVETPQHFRFCFSVFPGSLHSEDQDPVMCVSLAVIITRDHILNMSSCLALGEARHAFSLNFHNSMRQVLQLLPFYRLKT